MTTKTSNSPYENKRRSPKELMRETGIEQKQFVHLAGGNTSIIFNTTIGQTPSILYWGDRLDVNVNIPDIAYLNTRYKVRGTEYVSITPSLAMEPGLGMVGPSGLSVHRDGQDWGCLLEIENVKHNGNILSLHCIDKRTQLSLTYTFIIDEETGLVTTESELKNLSKDILDVNEMATACLPLPERMNDIIGFEGRWSDEFRRERLSRFRGGYVRENRTGRTSHDCFPAVFICESTTSEEKGRAYGFHLSWSGNHRTRVDTLANGRLIVSMGALFFPGEIRLSQGEIYKSPKIIAAYSSEGLSNLSRKFHNHVRTSLLTDNFKSKPRPVIYNTWEAVYFDHDVNKLKSLASKAAELGVERFVLDDGWFGDRRNATAGLGDWTVSKDVYPKGLSEIIDHVTSLGMEMGIWFEPEMVNPDSDLFRKHPDWILKLEGVEQVPYRGQYVLDLSRDEVTDYLYEKIDIVLRENNISYIKWDMNRHLNHPGDKNGYARAHHQVRAVWALIDRLKTAHPSVEIETCASGGARADLGILERTDRVWASDSNDAYDRQYIQRGASYILPLELIGSHVGPHVCHITGRTLTMPFRTATAMFGHMGLELNLFDETEEQLSSLKTGIDLYKRHRGLLHTGDLHRFDTPEYLMATGVISKDKSEALYSIAFMAGHSQTHADHFYFSGLDTKKSYRLKLIAPLQSPAVLAPNAMSLLGLEENGAVLSGELLVQNGLQLPNAFPLTSLIFHLESTS